MLPDQDHVTLTKKTMLLPDEGRPRLPKHSGTDRQLVMRVGTYHSSVCVRVCVRGRPDH